MPLMVSAIYVERTCHGCGKVESRKKQTWTKCKNQFGDEYCLDCEQWIRKVFNEGGKQ